tara:strand:+ start:743 stop:1306 length:564 start_codon:yes stop_codon:yes gene_type:complete
MANHVYTYIEVESENPKVFKKLQEMFPESDDWETQSDGMYLYNKLYGEAEYDRSEFTDRMGAKWCYVEDIEVGDDYFCMNTTSAWYYSEGAIEQLHHILSEIDKKVWVKFTFDDESPSQPLGGGAVYMGELSVEDEEFDAPNEDDFDTEELFDEAMDRYWEKQVNKKIDLRDSCIEYLTEEYADEED